MKRWFAKTGLWLTILSVLVGLLSMPLSVYGQFNDDQLDWNESEADTYYTYSVLYNTATITAVDPSLLGSITIPSFLGGFPVVAIDDSAFAGCGLITEIAIPEGITDIGVAAFSGCVALENVVIPESVTTIPVAAFSGCAALTSITLPASLRTVGLTAFTGCVALTDVYYGGLEADRETVTIHIPNSELLNATWHYDYIPPTPESHLYYTYTIDEGKATIMVVDKKIAGNVTVPTLLGGCPVVAIAEQAFENCENLTGLVLPAGLETIGTAAFRGCTALRSVAIPTGVRAMGEGAFSGCESLTAIRLPSSLSVVSDWAFEKCYALQEVHFGDRVTSVGIGAFRSCFSLTSVELPASIAIINGWAFDSCFSLEKMTVGACLQEIGICAFQNCESLTAIRLPETVTWLGEGAFAGCKALEQVNIPAAVSTLTADLFYGCKALTALTIPAGITTIFDGALSGCVGLTSITLPRSVTTINEAAFFGCDGLTDVYYADSEESQKSIYIAAGNQPLETAEWHYAVEPVLPTMPQFLVSSVSAAAGEIVTLQVQVQNNPGIATATLTATFDSTLMEWVEAEGQDFGMVEMVSVDADQVTLMWVSEDGDYKKDGVFALLRFRVKDTADAGASTTVALTYLPQDIYNKHWENVTFDTVSGTVSLSAPSDDIPGDANNDGVVNNKDLVLLIRYINGWDVMIHVEAMDVTGDGKLTVADVALLQQYLNGWKVELK